jgi:hypothetical protein
LFELRRYRRRIIRLKTVLDHGAPCGCAQVEMKLVIHRSPCAGEGQGYHEREKSWRAGGPAKPKIAEAN